MNPGGGSRMPNKSFRGNIVLQKIISDLVGLTNNLYEAFR